MYKKILKNIRETDLLKREFVTNLYKREHNPVKDTKPHFIFAVDNPRFADKTKIRMSHEDMLEFLRNKGYSVQEMSGKYGKQERSILVYDAPKHAIKHLFNLATNLGQESSIYSDGFNHEMHWHHGDKAGSHSKGQGTEYHKKVPEDYYSMMDDGTIFTHNIDAETGHGRHESIINHQPLPINKSEKDDAPAKTYAPKAAEHPLASAGPDTNLVHYSATEGLEELNPRYQGERVKTHGQRGKPAHPMTFFYLEGTQPESVVTSGSRHKYVVKKRDMKFYDISKDPDGLHSKIKEEADKRQVNKGLVTKEDMDNAIKEAGYHGIYNSALSSPMNSVVGSYYTTPIHSSHKIHKKDYKETSATDHHGDDAELDRAKQFAEKNQHHDARFLVNVKAALRDKE